jgi:hypothetical protein
LDLASKVAEYSNGSSVRLVLDIQADLAHVDTSHAVVFDYAESTGFKLTFTQQTFLAKDIETKTFGAIVEWLGGDDCKHVCVPF